MLQGRLALLDKQEPQVVLQDLQVQLVPKARPADHQDRQEPLVHRDHRDHRAIKVHPVRLDLKAHKDPRALSPQALTLRAEL